MNAEVIFEDPDQLLEGPCHDLSRSNGYNRTGL